MYLYLVNKSKQLPHFLTFYIYVQKTYKNSCNFLIICFNDFNTFLKLVENAITNKMGKIHVRDYNNFKAIKTNILEFKLVYGYMLCNLFRDYY